MVNLKLTADEAGSVYSAVMCTADEIDKHASDDNEWFQNEIKILRRIGERIKEAC